ncbi:MAG: dephospho-CoA kinase [Chitinophagaceae bacterium]|nr:dephospho-CoA kinase [Chitinophagaceae bacterium]
MLKVGITGGIGSGKSTVCQVFETLGIPVLYADTVAKNLMQKDPILRQNIIALLGKEAYTQNRLNTAFISQKVFADKEKLAALNAITHPAVTAYSYKWIERQNSPYILKEAALFYESGTHNQVDVMIGVSATLPVRIARTMQRDNISEEAVLARMSKQMNEDEKMSRCDYIILNNNNSPIIDQVLALHQKLMLR